MKSLGEMTTAELWGLKREVEARWAEAIRLDRPHAEMGRFRAAIDDELDRRGA